MAYAHSKVAEETPVSNRRAVLHVGMLALGNLWVCKAQASVDQADRRSLEVSQDLFSAISLLRFGKRREKEC